MGIIEVKPTALESGIIIINVILTVILT